MEKSLSPSVVTTAQSSSQIKDEKEEKRVEQICQWIQDLGDHEKRENALLEISKRRESVEDLAVWLWYSYGTVRFLFQSMNVFCNVQIAVYSSKRSSPFTRTSCRQHSPPPNRIECATRWP